MLVKPWRHTFLANGAIFASGLASGVIAARLLGAEDRGLLAAIIFWPHFVAGVAAMGLNEAIAIRTAKSGATESLRATTLALSLALALPLGTIGLLLLPHLLGESRQVYLPFTQIYFAAFLPLSFVAMNLLAIDQGEFRFHSYNIQRMIQAVAYPVLLVVFWIAGYLTVENAAIAAVAGTGIVALIRLWQAWPDLKNKPSLQEAAELLSQGTRLHATNLVMFLSMQIDKMALVLFSNDRQLGLYVVAVTAASAVQSLFVQTYLNIMLPTAAKSGSDLKNIETILAPLRRLFILILASTFLLILIFPYLLPLVFGKEYISAAPYAQVLAVAFALVGLKKAFVYLLRSWSKNRPGILGEGLTSLILIAGAYPSLQMWGVMGLSILILLAHAIGAFLLLYFLLKTTALSPRRMIGFARDYH
jgi:O-antigen/teichoic acid export membrane protein